MKKILNRIKSHLPTKRRLIQLYAALLFNANLKGFGNGKIYQGPLKNICTPGLNCYSCPGASGSCPVGALQNAMSSADKTVPYYIFGILLLYGFLFGRWICGFLCPFGLIQELLHKIKTPKLKKGKLTRILSYFKYVILIVFCLIIPLLYMVKDFPLPGFCKYICPAGTLEGAMGLLSNAVNASSFRMLGSLFTWKFLLMVSILVGSVFIYRIFCRFLCPLGALYGLFNKISMFGVKLERSKCTDCGKCITACKMDIRHVGDFECISCGECMKVCSAGAIVWKGSKPMLMPSEIEDATPEEAIRIAEEHNAKIKKRNRIIKIIAVSAMAVLLGAALIYYNFIDKAPGSDQPSTEDVTPPTDNGGGTDAPTATPGYNVGNLCFDRDLPLLKEDKSAFEGTLNIKDTRGKITFINFWYTQCGPCVQEMPHFAELIKHYGNDKVAVIACHADAPGWKDLCVQYFNDNPEWREFDINFVYDSDNAYYNQLGGPGGAYPYTLALDEDGIVVAVFPGSVTYEELEEIVEELLNK